MIRLLLVTTRTAGAAPDLDSAWARLRRAVEEAGGRAWRFRAAAGPDRHLEFVEWKQAPGGSRILDDAAVRAALADLDALAPFDTRDTWEEAP